MVSQDTCCKDVMIKVGPSTNSENMSINGKDIRLPQTTRESGDWASTFFVNIFPAAQEKAASNVNMSPTKEVPPLTWAATIPIPINDINEPQIFQRLGRSLKNKKASPIEKNI